MSEAGASQNQARLDQCRGLVLDEHPHERFAMSSTLRQAGAWVEFAVTPVEALKRIEAARLERQPYDFVIVHVSITRDRGFDGLEAIQTVRDSGFAAPILGLLETRSQAEVERLRDACLVSGADEAVNKTPTIPALLSSLREHFVASDGNVAASDHMSGVTASGLVMKRFVEKLPEKLDSLHAAIRENDILRLEAMLKGLKQSADAHGAASVSDAIREAERRLADNMADLQQFRRVVDQLMRISTQTQFGPTDTGPTRPVA